MRVGLGVTAECAFDSWRVYFCLSLVPSWCPAGMSGCWAQALGSPPSMAVRQGSAGVRGRRFWGHWKNKGLNFSSWWLSLGRPVGTACPAPGRRSRPPGCPDEAAHVGFRPGWSQRRGGGRGPSGGPGAPSFLSSQCGPWAGSGAGVPSDVTPWKSGIWPGL